MRFGAYLVFATLIVSVVLYTTPHGLGVSPDSASYIKGAAGILSGHGLQYLSSQWPPFYPIVISMFGWVFSGDVLLGARVLNAILYPIIFLLIFRLLKSNTRNNFWLNTGFAALLCMQPPIALVLYYAWSEPLFIALTLADLLILCSLRSTKHSTVLHLGLVAISTLALLTRLTGVTIIVLNCLTVLALSDQKKPLTRSAKALAQLIVPLIVFLPWVSHQGIGDSESTTRSVEFHLINTSALNNALETIGRWLYPMVGDPMSVTNQNVIAWTGVCLLLLPIILLLYAFTDHISRYQTKHSEPRGRVLISPLKPSLIISIYIVGYVLLLYSAVSFFDNKVPFDNRILAPIFLPLFILIIQSVSQFKNSVLRNGLLAILALSLLCTYPKLKGWLLFSKFNGVELSSVKVKTSPLHSLIQNCNRAARVFADKPWDFELHFSGKVLWLPSRTLYYTNQTNKNYEQQIKALSDQADLIVVEQVDSDVITDIEQLKTFRLIREDTSGRVWIRADSKTELCQ